MKAGFFVFAVETAGQLLCFNFSSFRAASAGPQPSEVNRIRGGASAVGKKVEPEQADREKPSRFTALFFAWNSRRVVLVRASRGSGESGKNTGGVMFLQCFQALREWKRRGRLLGRQQPGIDFHRFYRSAPGRYKLVTPIMP